MLCGQVKMMMVAMKASKGRPSEDDSGFGGFEEEMLGPHNRKYCTSKSMEYLHKSCV